MNKRNSRQRTTLEKDETGTYMYWWNGEYRVAFKRLEDHSINEWEEKNKKSLSWYKEKYYNE